MRHVLAALTLLLSPLPALASREPPPPPPEGRFCDEHLAQCEEMRARYDAYCDRNPETCRVAKQRRDERRRWCRKNPDRCEALHEEEARRAELWERCKAEPARCEEFKQKMRERREWRADRRRAFCNKYPDKCDASGQREKDAFERSGPPR